MRQLRIKDIATLQGILERLQPHPFATRKDELFVSRGEDRERIILQIRRDDYCYPPVFGSPEAIDWFSSLGGLALYLLVVLERDNEIDAQRAMELAENITPEEYVEFIAVTNHWTHRDRFYNFLRDKTPGPPTGLRPADDDWGRRIDEVARSHHLTYEQIGEMTISQFHIARSCGVVQRPSLPKKQRTHEELREELIRQRTLMGLEV